jgi:triosephosphate isomerase
MRELLYAANWKMNLGPSETRAFAAEFLAAVPVVEGRSIWFFPPAVSLATAAEAFRGRPDIRVGAQDIFWEPSGAYTGATSIPLAAAAGATATLVGHSERRHVFGETDQETGRKVRASIDGGLIPVLCVGERLEEREAGQTEEVVRRQLQLGLADVAPQELERVVIAYEPVWAIGTGRNATPADAALVHRHIRQHLEQRGTRARLRVLYGGSVKTGNVEALLAHPELDGVLVGGASLDPAEWATLVALVRVRA